jgi:pyruvate/2-oxoglutarate dehydrogenase complex dihydrolipoamide acyltransferase (E2) component
MLVTIVQKQRYLNEHGKGVTLAVGEQIEYPTNLDWYAESLVDSGFAIEGTATVGATEAFESIDDLMTELADGSKEAGQDTVIEEVEEVHATGAAVRRAEELGIDIAGVEGTGREGRITKTDVENAAGE